MSYFCITPRRVWFNFLCTLPLYPLQIAVRSPLALIFPRVNEHSALCLSLYVLCSSPDHHGNSSLASLLYVRVCPVPGAQAWAIRAVLPMPSNGSGSLLLCGVAPGAGAVLRPGCTAASWQLDGLRSPRTFLQSYFQPPAPACPIPGLSSALFRAPQWAVSHGIMPSKTLNRPKVCSSEVQSGCLRK